MLVKVSRILTNIEIEGSKRMDGTRMWVNKKHTVNANFYRKRSGNKLLGVPEYGKILLKLYL
jgi:hypothetical protein